MNIKIQREYAKSKTSSCRDLVYYLEKENTGKSFPNREYFFDHRREFILPELVIRNIDHLNAGFANGLSRYFMLMVCPSRKELEHLAGFACGRKVDYTVDMTEMEKNRYLCLFKAFNLRVMDLYAETFHRNVTKDDLDYYIKIEHHRRYSSRDPEVKDAQEKAGDFKEGLQTHSHIIISRMDIHQDKSLSPMTAYRGINGKEGSHNNKNAGGFYRARFHQDCERLFDNQFEFKRELETFVRRGNYVRLLDSPVLNTLFELSRQGYKTANQLEL